MLIKESISSLTELNAAVTYSVLDDELFALMMDKRCNSILQQFLLEEYFKETKNNFITSISNQQKLFDELEGKILHEPAEMYRSEIKALLAQENEEEFFIRGGVFKREIPKIYRNTCCISGMSVNATINISMVDACHIIPFSESYDDTIGNGIALRPNLHRAFDRGLITIDENFKVRVSNNFTDSNIDYSIRQFENKTILLPTNKDYFPKAENLRWHKKEKFS